MMFSEAPASRLDLTISCTCCDLEDVKIFVNSGISAAASVPQLIISDSRHHKSGLMLESITYEMPNVTAIDVSDVSQIRLVSGFSKSKIFSLP